MSWSNCKAECAHLDASMLCIADDETNVWLANKLIHNGQYPWIGYSDLPDKQGKYRWIDGCSSTYTNWYPGEPNNIGTEDCIAMTFNGRWENLPDVAYSYTVCGCEYSTVPSLTPSSEPLTPSTMEVSISTITIVIVLLLVVVIVVSSTLLVLYFYNMRVKWLKEKRIHVYETVEEHHDETDNRINNAAVISPEDIPITDMEDEEDEPASSLAIQHDDSFMYLCDKVEANEMAMESSIDFIKIRMMKMN